MREAKHERSAHAIRVLVAGLALMVLTAMAAPLDAQMKSPPAFLVTVSSSHGFDETLAMIKGAIAEENLMVIHEVNPQQMLRMVGMRTGGMRQILVFHPRFMKRIVATNPNASIEPPLKVIVMERPDGSVIVRYHDPVHLFEPYEGLESLAKELKEMVERIAGAVG